MRIDLIEQLGGYENSKGLLNLYEYSISFKYCLDSSGDFESWVYLDVFVPDLKQALLQYRREHNIFEEKDVIVFTDSFMHGELMTISWTRDGEVWMDDGAKRCTNLSMIRHAEPEEIQANRRLDQIKCWSCDKTMMHKQRSENDGFCIHCNAEVCGG